MKLAEFTMWRKLILIAIILQCIFIHVSYSGTPKLKYGFFPDWNTNDDNVVSEAANLPFVIQLQNDQPFFILLFEMSSKKTFQADWNELEVKLKWDDKPILLRSNNIPLEWRLEPKLITNLTTHVSLNFPLMEQALWKKIGENSCYCRVYLPIWKVSSKSNHFYCVSKVCSSWFKCNLKDGRIQSICTDKKSFEITDGSTIPFYSQLKQSAGILFKPIRFR